MYQIVRKFHSRSIGNRLDMLCMSVLFAASPADAGWGRDCKTCCGGWFSHSVACQNAKKARQNAKKKQECKEFLHWMSEHEQRHKQAYSSSPDDSGTDIYSQEGDSVPAQRPAPVETATYDRPKLESQAPASSDPGVIKRGLSHCKRNIKKYVAGAVVGVGGAYLAYKNPEEAAKYLHSAKDVIISGASKAGSKIAEGAKYAGSKISSGVKNLFGVVSKTDVKTAADTLGDGKGVTGALSSAWAALRGEPQERLAELIKRRRLATMQRLLDAES